MRGMLFYAPLNFSLGGVVQLYPIILIEHVQTDTKLVGINPYARYSLFFFHFLDDLSSFHSLYILSLINSFLLHVHMFNLVAVSQ